MPKLRDTRNIKDVNIQSVIAKYLIIRDMKVSDLIRRTGIKQSTYYYEMKHPEEFRIRDLRKIYDVLSVPVDERRDVL